MHMSGPAVLELDDIDLYDPQAYSDSSLHPAWAALRRAAPVTRRLTPSGVPFWSLTRYQDVVAALQDTDRFSSACGSLLAVAGGDPASGHTILLSDPPVHTQLRKPLARLLARQTSTAQAAQTREAVRALVRTHLSAEVNDFTELSAMLPMVALGPVLGIPRQHWSSLARWSMASLAPEDPLYAIGDPSTTLALAHHELYVILAELLEAPGEPRDDMIAVLRALDFGGRRMTAQEVMHNCHELVMATNSTTPHVANHLIAVLCDQPHVWEFLRRNRGATPLAVEEAIRWATPINHLMRQTRTDVDLGGAAVPAGSAVCLWLASANRDEAVFPHPYRFVPDRSPNRHVGFGRGVHHCIGARAARVALTALLSELLDLFERIELAAAPRHLRSNFVNGMTHLPIRAVPATRSNGGHHR